MRSSEKIEESAITVRNSIGGHREQFGKHKRLHGLPFGCLDMGDNADP